MKILNRVGRIATTKPNWVSSVTQEYQFKTSIITAFEGWEQREAMRETARVALQYRSALNTRGLQRHMGDLAEDPTGLFVIPVVWRNTELSASAASGQPDVTVAEVPFWLVPGASVVISDDQTEEAAVVASVAGSVVTLTENLQTSFGAASRVYQAYSARSQSRSQFSALVSTLWEGNVRYEVDPTSDPQARPASAPEVFEDREVFLTRPNWRSAPRVEFSDTREVFDPGRGNIDVFDVRDEIQHVVRLAYTGLSAAKSEELIAFFLRMKGRRNSFYMPTWQADIPLADTALSGSSILDLPGEDFLLSYGGTNTYETLFVRFADGSHQINRVAAFGQAGPNTRLTMQDPWAQDVTPDTVRNFCPLWRFASDTLSVSWLSSDVAEMEFALQTIMHEEEA